MEHARKLLPVLLIASFFAGASIAFAAWAATDNFDSYTTNASISGDNGGSGWSAAWAIGYGTVTTPAAPAGGQGGNAAMESSPVTLESTYNRSLTAVPSGSVRFDLYKTNMTTNSVQNYQLREGSSGSNCGGTIRIICRWSTSAAGTMECFNSDTSLYESVATGLSANTWYTVYWRFGSPVTANKYQVAIQTYGTAPSWSGDKGVSGASFTNIDNFCIDDQDTTNTSSNYVDNIMAYSPAVASPLSYSDDDLITQMLSLFYAQ